MKRIDIILIGLVLLEVSIGAMLFSRRSALPSPPLPMLSPSHSLRRDLEDRVTSCQTEEDWHQLAEIYTAYGFYAESEACYDFLLDLQPDSPTLLFESGFLLSQMGRWSDANAQFVAAIDAGSTDPMACWYFVGRNFQRGEHPDEAAQAFAKAGDLADAQLELARLRYRDGDPQGSLELLGTVLKESSDRIEPNTLAYLCELELGDTRAATQFADQAAQTPNRMTGPFFTQWTRLDTAVHSIGYRQRMAQEQARAERNRTALSEEILREAANLEWNEFAVYSLAELALMKGNFQHACELWQALIDRRGPSTIWLKRLADTYAQMQDLSRAVEVMKQAVEAQSEEDLTEAFGKLASWSESLKQYDEAERYAALEILWNGKMAYWNADWHAAESFLTAATKQMPESDEAWYFLGETLRRRHKDAEAAAAFDRCLALNPQHGGAYRGQANLGE